MLTQDYALWLVLLLPCSRTIQLKEGLPAKASGADRVFAFDTVLPADAPTQQLFTAHVGPLLAAALEGINVTVFAYGQTGSGER